MRKILSVITLILILSACGGNRDNSKFIESKKDSIGKQKTIDSPMAAAERPDREQEGPSLDEVKADFLKTYTRIEKIDTLIIDGNDSLNVHEKYYCLHDNTLVIPKTYMLGEKTPRDFVTHNFASHFLIINKKDTVINRIFERGDFDSALAGNLKKYAIIFNPTFIGYNKAKEEFAFGYSISIPLTDVGVPAYLIIDKKGDYKVLNEYAKMDDYKK